MKNYYIVRMNRWGNQDGHSYVIGIFSSLSLAKIHGGIHHYYRSGKYDPEIVESQNIEKDSFILFEYSEYDRKNMSFKIATSKEELEDFIFMQNKKNLFFKNLPVISTLDKETMLEAHNYLNSTFFDNKDIELIRDAYEKYAREYLNL